MTRARLLSLGTVLLLACSQKETSPPSVAPAPLPMFAADGVDSGDEVKAREALFALEPVPVWGDEPPGAAVAVRVEAASLSTAATKVDREAAGWPAKLLQAIGERSAVLLTFDAERYLADAADLFAMLASARREVWLRHPDAPVAYRVILLDNAQFERWLSEAKPGKIRVIQRADGFELQTNIGKMAGADPNGPTVPTRGGKLDIARLRRALTLLRQRFPKAEDSCLVPSYGTELHSIARALSGYYQAQGQRIFADLCLVYPPGPSGPAAAAAGR